MFIGFPICGGMNIRNYQLFWCENQATSGGSLRAILVAVPMDCQWAEQQTFWVNIEDHVGIQQSYLGVFGHPPNLIGHNRKGSSMIHHPKTGTASWCNLDNLAFWNCWCPHCGPDCEFVHDATPSFVDHLGVRKVWKGCIPSHQSCIFTSMITFSETSCTRVVSSLPNSKSRGRRSAFIWSCLLRSCFLWLCLTHVSLKFQKRSTKAVNTLERKN